MQEKKKEEDDAHADEKRLKLFVRFPEVWVNDSHQNDSLFPFERMDGIYWTLEWLPGSI